MYIGKGDLWPTINRLQINVCFFLSSPHLLAEKAILSMLDGNQPV